MKPTHLKTLSARIDEIHFLLSVDRITTFRAYDLIFDYNDFLKQPLTLSQFVPCDENGNPLEVPTMESIKEAAGLTVPWGLAYHQAMQKYLKALQNVIFEGWEVRYCSEGFIGIGNTLLGLRLQYNEHECNFSLSDGKIIIKENIKNLSDLADATIENPLKLK